MPLPNVHTARQMAPGTCGTIRQKEITPGVTLNLCINGNNASDVQSVHFDAKKFTPEQAKAWLEKHDFKADQFIPASTNAAAQTDLCAQMMDVADCPSADCPMKKKAADSATADGKPLEIKAAIGGGIEFLAAQAGANDNLTRVNLLAYTGVPMKLDGFAHPVVVDLDTLKIPRQKVPILRAHEADRIAGHTESLDKTPQRLKATGVLSGITENTSDLVHTGKNGFPWQASIGAQTTTRPEFIAAGETAKVNGRNWPGPVYVARNAVLREISAVPMGADGNTDASFASEADLQPDQQGG